MHTSSAVSNPALRHAVTTPPHALQTLETLAVIKSSSSRQEICREGQTASTCYQLVSGAALCCVIMGDGRRQIIDLLFPGDFFGLTGGAKYERSVEAAACGAVVAAYPRKSVELAANADPDIAHQIQQIAYKRLARLQEQVLIVGRVRVQQKVASFIVAMSDRLSDGKSQCVTIPISRYEIADYLAVSAETVSRALSDLRQRRLIRLLGMRTIQILNRRVLEGDAENEQSGNLRDFAK